MSKDIGNKYENLLFLELRRKSKELYYWKGNKEVDFIYDDSGSIQLINVAYDLSDLKNYERELSGLIEAMDEQGVKKATIINSEMEKVFTIDEKNHSNNSTLEMALEIIWKMQKSLICVSYLFMNCFVCDNDCFLKRVRYEL